MKTRLHPDWKKKLRHAWSVRFIALAAVLAGMEAMLPYLPAFLTLSPQVMGVLTGLVVAGAFISNVFVSQKVFRDAD
ncbi:MULTISPECIES: hypothetical protein [unclassified Mesorhizobium]|uniref:DUF7940 domain-containing protein n=1 Tax=unclassified Mesorhizobium TaxID=325217 RepID=UPI00112B533C|nr:MULTISPECIES: hypothetical protein [unclassified Mesorhizobium]TPL42632.1 hypothetical protein FJ961_08050 [Mesorhizobium sp. B2-4-5]TPL66635.1 hypothetical protein FJ949_09730 [Mesorhizobium sp. B2-4-1]